MSLPSGHNQWQSESYKNATTAAALDADMPHAATLQALSQTMIIPLELACDLAKKEKELSLMKAAKESLAKVRELKLMAAKNAVANAKAKQTEQGLCAQCGKRRTQAQDVSNAGGCSCAAPSNWWGQLQDQLNSKMTIESPLAAEVERRQLAEVEQASAQEERARQQRVAGAILQQQRARAEAITAAAAAHARVHVGAAAGKKAVAAAKREALLKKRDAAKARLAEREGRAEREGTARSTRSPIKGSPIKGSPIKKRGAERYGSSWCAEGGKRRRVGNGSGGGDEEENMEEEEEDYAQQQQQEDSSFKKSMCKFYLEERCRSGSCCTYAHHENELQRGSSGGGDFNRDGGKEYEEEEQEEEQEGQEEQEYGEQQEEEAEGATGYVFMSSSATCKECIDRSLLGGPAGSLRSMQQHIDGRTKLFLLDFDTKTVHGVFTAVARARMDIVQDAWAKTGRGRKFPAQIRVRRGETYSVAVKPRECKRGGLYQSGPYSADMTAALLKELCREEVRRGGRGGNGRSNSNSRSHSRSRSRSTVARWSGQ
jgi:hypothetical protein